MAQSLTVSVARFPKCQFGAMNDNGTEKKCGNQCQGYTGSDNSIAWMISDCILAYLLWVL